MPTGNGTASATLKKKDDSKKTDATSDPDSELMYKLAGSNGTVAHDSTGSSPLDYPAFGTSDNVVYAGTLPRRVPPQPEEVPLTSIYGTVRRGPAGGIRSLPLPPSPPLRGGGFANSRSPSPRAGTSTFKPPDTPTGQANPGYQFSPPSPLPQSPSTYDNLDGPPLSQLSKSEEDLGPPPPVQPRPPKTRLPRKEPPSPQLRSSSPWHQSPDGSSQDIKRHTPEGAITANQGQGDRLPPMPPPAIITRKPMPPPKPVKRVHYDLPPQDETDYNSANEFSSGEGLNSPDGASSNEGTPRHRNPASARLLEYCDELIAELQTMATN